MKSREIAIKARGRYKILIGAVLEALRDGGVIIEESKQGYIFTHEELGAFVEALKKEWENGTQSKGKGESTGA